MKTLHLVYSFPPDPAGGTEIYVAALCRTLQDLGDEVVVAAPAARDEAYDVDGLAVRRFAINGRGLDLAATYGAGDRVAAEAFGRLVDRERPDVVHQHALTPACSVGCAAEAKARGLPVVFTYHTPTVTCARGTLIERGRRVCDGEVAVERCATCVLEAHGVGVRASRVIGHAPVSIGRTAARLYLTGGLWTAVRMTSLIDDRIAMVHRLIELVDRFVVLAPWVAAVLEANGVPAGKLAVCPHGVAGRPVAPRPVGERVGPIRIAHLGRFDPAKGTAVLLRGLARVPDAPVRLDIFGVVQGGSGASHAAEIAEAARLDPRVHIEPPIPHEMVVDRLSEYDLVAVPSQWMETGPLVVLESFAAGTPVMGSDLGGVADKITNGVDGLLVAPYDSPDAWGSALARLASEPDLLRQLRGAVRRPRAAEDVAREMRRIYAEVAAA